MRQPGTSPSAVGLHASGRSRADLQGLRAVAVLAVIGYHFGIAGMPGGFVGVDVFFVLSGFFITRLLFRDIEEHGRIRLGRFWANRVKRLLPNGLLTILCVLAASILLLPHYRLANISQDALAAAAFFANFHFADRAIDYFHLDDPASPLLHYWSLAVEEQFYVALPLLMTLVAFGTRIRKRTTIVTLLAVMAVASFAGSLIALEHSQPAAFFQPWYRAWQLACGGLVGMVFDRRETIPQAFRAGGALCGFLAILASIVLLHDDLSYPGPWALGPTLGTAALVFGVDAGRLATPIARFLALPPMVMIGDMSYSLYLWHWPVSIFMAELWPATGEPAFILVGLAVTGALAAGAYRLVERPIHHWQLPERRLWRPLAWGAGGVVLVAGTSLGATSLSRTDPAIADLVAKASADLGPNYQNGCHLDLKDVIQPNCRFGQVGGPRVVLFGDSHAAQWFTPLLKAAAEAGWEMEAWTKTSCPTADVVVWYPLARSIYEQCGEWRAARLREIVKNPPDLVLLGNFTGYYGWIFDERRGRVADRAEAERLWREGMKQTGEMLVAAGIPVVELHDTPRMYTSYKACLSGEPWDRCARPRGEALAGLTSPQIDAPLYLRLDLSDVLCTLKLCPAAIGETILYRDRHHLTATYAASLYPYFAELLVSRSKRNSE